MAVIFNDTESPKERWAYFIARALRVYSGLGLCLAAAHHFLGGWGMVAVLGVYLVMP